MTSAERITGACDALYEAVADENHWPTALAGLSAVLGADSGHFVQWNKRSGGASFAVTGQGNKGLAARYASEYGKIDPSRIALERGRPGAWIANHTLFETRAFQRDPYNAEFLFPQGYRYVLKSRVLDHADGSGYSVFGFVRPPHAEPFSGSSLAAVCQELGPHLTRAAKLFERLAPARTDGRLSEAALDKLSAPVIVVGADRRILLANQAATTFLKSGNGLSDRRGILRIDDAEGDLQLRALTKLGSPGGVIRIPSGLVRPIVLSIAPLHERIDLPGTGGDPCSIVLITPAQTNLDAPCCDRLRKGYGLTSAEARLAGCVAAGLSIAETAARQGVTVGTARTELKRIFAKMNVSRQGELVAVVAHLNRFLLE